MMLGNLSVSAKCVWTNALWARYAPRARWNFATPQT